MPYLALNPASAVAAPATTLGDPLSDSGMSLGEMRRQLQVQLGGRTDFDNEMFDLWINQAYLDLCSSLEIEDTKATLTLSTVASQPLYLLPKSIRAIRVISVVDTQHYGSTGGRRLNSIDLNAYRMARNDRGEPREYVREKDLLILYPTPSNIRALAIDVWLRPNKLVNDNDCPMIAEEWHEVIVRNARTKAHSDLREFEKAAITNNEFIGLVRRKDDPSETEDSDRVVGSSVPRSSRSLYRRHTRGGWDGLR